MKQLAILLCIVVVIFGIASPFLAGMFGHGPLHEWFYALPTAVDQLLWPEGDVLTLALAMLAFTVQYVVLFAVAAATPPLILRALDFLASEHWDGLMDPPR